MDAKLKARIINEVEAAVRNQIVASMQECALKCALAQNLAPFVVVNSATFPRCVANAVGRAMAQKDVERENADLHG